MLVLIDKCNLQVIVLLNFSYNICIHFQNEVAIILQRVLNLRAILLSDLTEKAQVEPAVYINMRLTSVSSDDATSDHSDLSSGVWSQHVCDEEVLEDFEEEVDGRYPVSSTLQVMEVRSWPDVEACLMTPPKKSFDGIIPWTPTANLKLLLKAASPDLRMRDLREAKPNAKTKPKNSKKKKLVPDNLAVKTAELENGMTPQTNMTSEWTDFGKRKEKSLGLLCHRYCSD